MQLLQLREPINALSHGAGMLVAIPVTWFLWKRCISELCCDNVSSQPIANGHRRIKALSLVVFGITLMVCYGTSAVFHGARVSGAPLIRLQRLDHVGIYLLIAGTYTPIAWSLLRGPWVWGTLMTVWLTTVVCGTRVLCGELMPVWISTVTYLAMGWGALFCYNELARSHSHRKLLMLPLGGLFYSVGAIMNLMHWPVLFPGVFAAHEIFHFFVISGTTCHVLFMLGVVIPSPAPAPLPIRAGTRILADAPRRAFFVRDTRLFKLPPFPRLAWPTRLALAPPQMGIRDELATGPVDNVAELA